MTKIYGNIRMRTQIITSFGGTDQFKPLELPIPKVKPGYVLIKVAATSVNPVDYKIRAGIYSGIAPEFPAILHGDVAGTITAVGEDAPQFKIGDEVYGCAGGVKGEQGALSEYMLADARLIAIKPKSITMQEAAALPLVSITAWEALVDKLNLKPKQTILIHGGSGGVGHIAVQLALSLGATVYTTVSSQENAKRLSYLPAKQIINYREESVDDYVNRVTGGKGFDFVFDTVGAKNLETSFKALAHYGTVVTTQANVTIDLSQLHSRSGDLKTVLMLIPLLFNKNREHHGKILLEIAKKVDAGEIKPLIYPQSFSFAHVNEAHELAESGKAYGKIVLRQAD